MVFDAVPSSVSLSVAGWLSTVVFSYLAAGAVFAPLFLVFGIGRVDQAARGTSVLFRLLIAPATVALWPFLLRDWRRSWRETP